jgi:hypothetical protein
MNGGVKAEAVAAAVLAGVKERAVRMVLALAVGATD